jgi:hypothetical protein
VTLAVPAEDHEAVVVVPKAEPLPKPVIQPSMMINPAPSLTAEHSEMPETPAMAGTDQDQQEPQNKADNTQPSGDERKNSGSYIDGLKAEGITDLSVDQLIAMKVQNVTPEYVHSIHALGLKPDVNDLIAMKVQGVTAEVIQKLRDSGLALDIDRIIAMQVQGITPEYIKGLHDSGIDTDAGNVIAMKVQGITPEYVRAMRQSTDEKLMGGELVAMKVQGVTPEYVHEFKAMGLQLDAGEIIAMKVQGVTPEYIKGLQSAGLKLDAHEVIAVKVQGITPEFVEKARQHGFQNLSFDKLMMLKHSGVLDE